MRFEEQLCPCHLKKISKLIFNKDREYTDACLLPPNPKSPDLKTLVLDLDETLVHSTFDYIDNPDLIINMEVDEIIYEIYVLIRPGCFEFIEELSKYYELVIFTASLSKYADPLITKLDINNKCKHRLFREHCTYIDGAYVKDLSKLGRNLRNTVIVDNSPISYSLQQNNGIPIKSWYEDKDDRELFNLMAILKNLSGFYDIRTEIPKFICNNTLIWHKAVEWVEENYVAMPISSPKTNAASTIRSSNKNLLSPVSNQSVSPNRTIVYDSIDADESAYEMVDTENFDRPKSREVDLPLNIGNSLLTNSNININIINGNFNKYIYTGKNSPYKKLPIPLETDEDIYRAVNTEDNLITKSPTQNILQGLKTSNLLNNQMIKNKENISPKVELHYFNKKKNATKGNINIQEEPSLSNHLNSSKDAPLRLNTDSIVTDEINYCQTQASIQNTDSNINYQNQFSNINNKSYVTLHTCPHNSNMNNPIQVSYNTKKNSINLYKVKNNFSSFIRSEVSHPVHSKTTKLPITNNNNQTNPNTNPNAASNLINHNNYYSLSNINNSITNSIHNMSHLMGRTPLIGKSLINTSSTSNKQTSYINYLTAGNNFKNKTRNLISTTSTNNNKSSKNESIGTEANTINRKSTPTNIHSLKNKSVVYSTGRNGSSSGSNYQSNYQKLLSNLNTSKERENSNSQTHTNNNNHLPPNSDNLLRYSANSNLSGPINNAKSKISPKLEELRRMYNEKLIDTIKNRNIKKSINSIQSIHNMQNHQSLKKSSSINKSQNVRSKSDLFTSYENNNTINNKRDNLFSAAGEKRGINRLNSFNINNNENSQSYNQNINNTLTYSGNMRTSVNQVSQGTSTTPTNLNKSKDIGSPNSKNPNVNFKEKFSNLKHQSRNLNDYLIRMREFYKLKKEQNLMGGNFKLK